ncbi:MAG: hypothetical protein JOY54_19455 [Acidobacteriaceae bacterium]|nr:hypothetical protein [Acidobacteriaceae bacterium]
MSNTIDQYREAKTNYLKLRNQAKKELLAKFNELAGELVQLQRELLEDFGEKVAMPSKAHKPRSVKGQKSAEKNAPQQMSAAPVSAKIMGMQKEIEKQKKKLADAQSAGKPTKAIEDRLYELEDGLRLAQGK